MLDGFWHEGEYVLFDNDPSDDMFIVTTPRGDVRVYDLVDEDGGSF